MTEKEKMLAHLWYNANNDKTLIQERLNCKQLCFEYNASSPAETGEKDELLHRIFGKVGRNCIIEPNFYCDYGYLISIGDNFYANHNCVMLDGGSITFGNNVFIGPNCGFYTAEHPLESSKRNFGLEKAEAIKVGNNVWIGANVCILSGVSIGNNAVIGAGSVVTKDIPDNTLAYGNPCRLQGNI